MIVEITVDRNPISLSAIQDWELIDVILSDQAAKIFGHIPSISIRLVKTKSSLHGEIFDQTETKIGHVVVSLKSSPLYVKVFSV